MGLSSDLTRSSFALISAVAASCFTALISAMVASCLTGMLVFFFSLFSTNTLVFNLKLGPFGFGQVQERGSL